MLLYTFTRKDCPWLLRSIVQIVSKEIPYWIFITELVLIKRNAARVSPAQTQLHRFRHCCVANIAVQCAARLKWLWARWIRHIFARIQFIMTTARAGTRVLFVQIRIVMVRNNCLGHFDVNCPFVCVH